MTSIPSTSSARGSSSHPLALDRDLHQHTHYPFAVIDDNHMDLETARSIAELYLQDIADIEGRRKGKVQTGIKSDEEYALELMANDLQGVLSLSDDNRLAHGISRALEADATFSDASMTPEAAGEAALRATAEARPPIPAQARLENWEFNMESKIVNNSPQTHPNFAKVDPAPKRENSAMGMPSFSEFRSPATADNASSFQNFLDIATPPALIYSDFTNNIVQRPRFDPSIHHSPSIFEKIVTPYSADAFELALANHGLVSKYPLLCQNLRNGFPLGEMPDIPHTNILPNHFSTLGHEETIDEYLKEEVASGRMDGPFTRLETERILRGPFQCSPLLIVVQPQGYNLPDKIRVCRHLSKANTRQNIPSVNSFIDKEDFPTRFDTASKVAAMVSLANLHFSNTLLALCAGLQPQNSSVSCAIS
ncbi:hypothetical protein CVT24_004343 [Panaeolus cyanescens]|uniref:Uncharacterized protein n=1 Tax=Panaeolus cyanescens TaxID=181874 RepID=A0A409WVW8_9AGAR|nr:hypothetical protein CVT24_004343 [Panaeolus cyanescens]